MRLCPWSLASSIPVLGLESVCPRKGCPWPLPWPGIFFVSLTLASSLLSSTPPLAICFAKMGKPVKKLNCPALSAFLYLQVKSKTRLKAFIFGLNFQSDLAKRGTEALFAPTYGLHHYLGHPLMRLTCKSIEADGQRKENNSCCCVATNITC